MTDLTAARVLVAEEVAAIRNELEILAVDTAAESTLAQRQAAGLRALADMIEQNPQVAEWMQHSFSYSGINAHLSNSRDKAEQQAEFARAARCHGATTTKAIDDQWHTLVADFGAVKVAALAYREEVCERVVTGTREVTEEVPDPAALAAVPTVTVTRVVEDTEWICKPLLSSADLTYSEHTTAQLASQGLTNLQIARRLHVTTSTVEQHLTRVYRKTGAKNRAGLPVVLGAATNPTPKD